MRNIKKGFTLIEIVVVILITSILLAVGGTFFNTIKVSSRQKLIESEVEKINSFLNNNNISDYYLDGYNDVVKYKEINTMNKNKYTDIYYNISVIKPVIVNKTDINRKVLNVNEIGNTENSYNDITIGLQKCLYLFDTNGKNIDGKSYKQYCDEPILSNIINIQGYILGKKSNFNIERENYYFNNNNYFGRKFSITDFNTDKILIDKGVASNELYNGNYYYYDLLNDNINNFYEKGFLIFKIKNINNDIEEGIFTGTESDFVNLIKNQYIPGILNNTVLNTSNLNQDREDRKNLKLGLYQDIQFLYHDPNDFKDGYNELLFIGLKKHEKD